MKNTLAASFLLAALGIAAPALSQPDSGCEGGWNEHFPMTHGNYMTFVEWDPDGAGPQRRLLVYGSPSGNYLRAWDGVYSIKLGDAVWSSVYEVGTWRGNLVAAGLVRLRGQPEAAMTVAMFDGVTWRSLGVPSELISMRELVEFQGDLYFAGSIRDAQGWFVDGIARFDGTKWNAVGGGLNGDANRLVVNGDRLIVGGQFTTAGGQDIPYLASWDGETWSAPTKAISEPVRVMEVLNGRVCIAGATEYGYPAMLMWANGVWTALPLPAGFPGTITDARVFHNELYVVGNTGPCEGGGGGGFPAPPCLWQPTVARWDGARWRVSDADWRAKGYWGLGSFGPEVFVGRTQARLSDPLNHIGRLTASGTPWFIDEPRSVKVEAGAGASLTAATVIGYDDDGPIAFQWLRNGAPVSNGPGGAGAGGGVVSGASGVLGGSMSTTLVISGVARADAGEYRCVLTNSCRTVESLEATLAVNGCRADFNADGTVNSTDVSDFVNAWFEDQAAGSLVTDWDANGVSNSTDVSEFINDWFVDAGAGCG